MPSFIEFLLVVYPAGVTDLRPFFTQKIDPNSLIGFQPKLVRRCALISPSRVPSFSLIGGCDCKVWLKMQSVRNEEEAKNKEIILKLCSLVSRDWLARFASNLKCRFT